MKYAIDTSHPFPNKQTKTDRMFFVLFTVSRNPQFGASCRGQVKHLIYVHSLPTPTPRVDLFIMITVARMMTTAIIVFLLFCFVLVLVSGGCYGYISKKLLLFFLPIPFRIQFYSFKNRLGHQAGRAITQFFVFSNEGNQ